MRAAAALLVVNGHFVAAAIKLGQLPSPGQAYYASELGVQLFFVLSGFLIGGLLLDIVDRGGGVQEWRLFLIRRWMRTVPLYLFWIAVLLVVAPPVQDVALHLVRYLTFTQNLLWPMPAGNWFGVSWTLAIEEWFYLLFSGLLLLLVRFGRTRAIIVSSLAFLLIPLLLRIVIGPLSADGDAGFRKIAAFRLDAIAYGFVLAALWRHFATFALRWRWLLALGGVALLAFAMFVNARYGFGYKWRSIEYSMTPFALAMMFPAAIGLRLNGGLLRSAIEWVAERTYAIYVIHLDIVLWSAAASTKAQLMPPALCIPVALAATLLTADLCYRFVERPIMRRRPAQFRQGPVGAMALRT